MFLTVAMLLAGVAASRAADSLQWDAARDRVDATIETWTVPRVLQHVATATGWEIFVDPQITNRIATKFTGKQTGDALGRLLGNYNYALVPETNAASRFYVFRNSRDLHLQSVASNWPAERLKMPKMQFDRLRPRPLEVASQKCHLIRFLALKCSVERVRHRSWIRRFRQRLLHSNN